MAFSLSSWFKGKPSDQEDGPNVGGAPTQEAAPAPIPPAPTAPQPASVRTVMPKSSQPVNLRDPGVRQPVVLTSAAPPPVTTNRLPAVRPAPGRKITFPVPSSPRPLAAAPTPVQSPAAVPPAPAPMPTAPDVTVTLEVGDFLDRLPPSFLSPGPHDQHQKVEFRASELYSDLTKGRASVPASTIYAKFPAIFARPVTDTEDVEVTLPLQKLVEQLSAAFQTRTDQVAEENVGEIETPFLQVAKEDSERLPTAAGTVAGAIRPTVPLPPAPTIAPPSLAETVPGFPVRPPHRTGQISTITAPKVPLDVPTPLPVAGSPATGPINPGKRPPSTVRASVAGGKIRLSGPSAVTRMSPAPVHPIAPGGAVNPPPSGPTGPSTASQRIQLPLQGPGPAASPSLAVSKKTARIQIPPISLRTGGPGAGARPGAVPPAAAPVQPSPVSIRPPTGTDIPVTFRSSPPPPSAKAPPPSFAPAPRPSFAPPAFPAIPPAAPVAVAPAPLAPTPPDDRKISLGLAAVLRGIPSELLTVEPYTIPDDVRFTLPFAGVEKQLGLGRVSIALETFVQAIPENFRHVIAPNSGLTEIQIPLPEVFQNLPASALAIRPDQVSEETGAHYPTPFSQKADEDALRLGVSDTPTAPAEPAPTPVVAASENPTASAEDEAPPASFIDQPLPITEAPAPTLEAEVPSEPVRDIPLDSLESPEPFGTSHLTDSQPVSVDPVVEPPAAAEPSPLEEALAMMESTAPTDLHEGAAQPVGTTPEAATPPEPVATVAANVPAVAPTKGNDAELQTLFMTEEEIDAKVLVRLVSQLPGVNGCAVMFADGLRLAGNFPEGNAEGFSAMAPPFYKRTQTFVNELKLGGLKSFTLYTEEDLLSFFMHDDICVSVRHTGRGFLPGVREKLEIVTRAMASIYSTAKTVSVDYTL